MCSCSEKKMTRDLKVPLAPPSHLPVINFLQSYHSPASCIFFFLNLELNEEVGSEYEGYSVKVYGPLMSPLTLTWMVLISV